MSIFLSLSIILFLYMNAWFILSVFFKRNDIADVAWGLGFVLLAWSSYILSPEKHVVGALVSILVSVWGSRLAWHIFLRNWGKPEDYRYQEWRQAWGRWVYLRSYFQIYILQGFFLFLIASSVVVINLTLDLQPSLLVALGIVVWVIGFFFEAVGDWQLQAFIKDPQNKGKLMTTGLWAYTRHPNYFGEVTQWWGIWLVALSSSTLGLAAVLSPLTITFLILKVSGIPMLEKKMQKKPEFAEYSRRVSAFFPLPPKK